MSTPEFASPFPTAAYKTAHDAREGLRQLHKDLGRIVGPDGIDEQRTVELGGFRQWVTLRGQSRRAPVLLFLHGGPGDAVSDVAYAYQRPWEDFFLVVNWDQRGSGRSFGPEGDMARVTAGITREQLLADAIELIDKLRAEFGQQRVILVGQSWGTVMALILAHRRPDLLHLAVLQGLAVEWLASAERVRLALINEAEQAGQTAEAERLRVLGPVPDASAGAAKLVEWGMRLGVPIPDRHTWHNIAGPGDGWLRRIDALRYVSPDLPPAVYDEDCRRAVQLAQAKLERHVAGMAVAISWNARADVGTRFQVPIVVMQGRHDWQTDTSLARAYFDEVQAPWKQWIEFPHAAHALNIEQPGLSVVGLVNTALPAIAGRIPEGAVVGLPE